MIKSMLALCLGAAAGALLRWFLGLALNACWAWLPLGTLAANLLGGYLAGFAVSLFGAMPALGAELRLLVMTGFLGALTTFSTFSLELCSMLQEQRFLPALTALLLHVCGSVAAVALGMLTFAMIRQA